MKRQLQAVIALLSLLGATAGLAQGWVRTLVPGTERCLSWKTRQLTYAIDAAGSTATPGDTEFAAIEASFQTWRSLSESCSDFEFVNAGRSGSVVVGNFPGSSGQCLVTFREERCQDVVPEGEPCLADSSCANTYGCWDHGTYVIALTTLTFSTKTDAIFDGDIELNAAPRPEGALLFTTVESPPCPLGGESFSCVATDVQNTVTHELGHVLGFDHVADSSSTMADTADVGDTNKRLIDARTAAGFCVAYPRGQPNGPCELASTVEQGIIGTTRIAGVGCNSAWGSLGSGLVLLGLVLRRRQRPCRGPRRMNLP